MNDGNVDKSDPIQLHLTFLEAQNLISKVRYYRDLFLPLISFYLQTSSFLAEDDAVKLAATGLQAQHGNYDPNVHTKEWIEKNCGKTVRIKSFEIRVFKTLFIEIGCGCCQHR